MAGAEYKLFPQPVPTALYDFLTTGESQNSDYDVVMIDDPWLPALAVSKSQSAHLQLKRLSDADADEDFVEACRNVCRYPYRTGRLYAVPFLGNSQFLLYDRRKVQAASPKTWENIARSAERAGKARLYGYVMRASPGNAAVTNFLPILWAFGGSLLCVNNTDGIAALKMMLSLGDQSPEAYPEFNDYDVAEYMRKRAAAVSINWFAWSAFVDEGQAGEIGGHWQLAARNISIIKADRIGEPVSTVCN